MPRCRDCGQHIEFETLRTGKKRPVNMDGSAHFGTCRTEVQPRPKGPPLNVCVKCGSVDVEVTQPTSGQPGGVRCSDCGFHRWLRKEAVRA